MPFPLQIRRYSQALLKHLGLQGHVGLTLIDDIMPMLDLWSQRPDLAFILDERRFQWHVAQAAVVGQFSKVSLENPSASRYLVVALRWWVIVAGLWRWGIIGAQFPNGQGQAFALDSRLGVPLGNTVAAVYGSATAVADLGATQATWTGNNAISEPFEAVLAPGARLVVECQTVNTPIEVTFGWRERALAPQELSGG